MENKNNISKEDFLKLFDSNEPKDLEHLDDFEKEALEGLKMMKNPSIVNSIDAKIDTKLAELVAAEKKGGKRAGMYFLSIAASIALVIGLFFIFKQTEPSLKEEVAVVKEQEAKDATGAITDAEPKIDSDGKIVAEQKPDLYEKQLPGNSLGPVEEKSLETMAFAENGKDLALQKGNTKYEVKKEAEGYIADDRKEIVATPPVMAGDVMNDESVVVNSKDKDANLDLEEKVVVTDNIKLAETDGKKDEAFKTKVSKKNAETKNRAITPAENAAPTVAQTIVGTSNNTNTNTNNTTTFTNTAGSGVIANNTISANSISANKPASYVVSEFVGGKKALDEYIKKNLKVPATCPAEEIIIVKFSVDASGKISKPKIESKTGNCTDCEKEALNFVKNMPNWKAATQDGKAIASKQQVVLSFKK